MRVTDIRVSDPRRQALVGRAAAGELLPAAGHPGQYIVLDVRREPGQALNPGAMYAIASSAGASLSWEYSHMDVTRDGYTLYVFYEHR